MKLRHGLSDYEYVGAVLQVQNLVAAVNFVLPYSDHHTLRYKKVTKHMKPNKIIISNDNGTI